MKIALDVDGVLADVIIPWLDYNNKIRGTICKDDITDWNFWKRFKIDRYDFYAELAMCWKNWNSIPPTENNLSDSIAKISEIAQVDIVTARERHTDSFVKDWLKHHNITYENYIPVVSGPRKADLDYDVFIDDSPLNAQKIIQNKKTMYLYLQPWNRHIDSDKIYRVSSLSQVLDHLTLKHTF